MTDGPAPSAPAPSSSPAPVDDHAAAVAVLRKLTPEEPDEAEAPAEEAAPEASEEAAEGEDGDADEEADKPEGEAKAEPPKSPPWKAYERKKAALREERAAVERAKAEVNAQAERAGRAMHLERQVQALRAKGDPIAVLEAFGFTYEQATHHVLRAGTPEAETSSLRKELEALKQATSSREQAAARQAVEQTFLAAAGDSTAYPELALYLETMGRDEVISSADSVADQLRDQLRRAPTFDEIAAELDRRAGIFHSKIRGRAGHGTALPAKATGPGKQAKPSASSTPRTLSNRHAQEAGKAAPEETDEQREKRVARQLRAAFRGKTP
jgi:hypothetical protein